MESAEQTPLKEIAMRRISEGSPEKMVKIQKEVFSLWHILK